MAFNKEAVAILLDVGPGMGQGPEPTCLTVSKEAINMILQRKLFSESKDEVSLILFGTTDTANDLASDDGYQNITVARPLGPVNWELLKYLQNDVKPDNIAADFVDALVVAMDHLVKGIEGKKGFASKRIILFSNVTGEFSDDHLDDIIASFKESNIELNIIGPKLDDDDNDDSKSNGAENGDTSKPKTPQQRAGETLLQHMVEAVNGESYSFSEALPALSFFQSRQVRSTAWKAPLKIGSSLEIPICLYTRIKEVKAKGFKNVCAKNVDAEIERSRTYHLNDEEETEIDKTETADGNRYGSTLVPFSADDREAMKFKTEKCFKVLGFTKSENVKRHQYMGDTTWICVAEKGDESATVALSALINALYETNMVAIVRRVHASNGNVKLGCLLPHIKTKYECLFYVELPFAEDLRQFTFGSLPVTEANTAASKKFTPNDDHLTLIDELIDTMDLSSAVKDEDDKRVEAMKPKLIFNPYLQRLYQCLQHRALKPSEDLPELSHVIANSLKPPSEITANGNPVLEKMKKTFKLRTVEKKEKEAGANVFADTVGVESKTSDPANEPAASGGLPGILKTKLTQVGSTTPVEDFQELISQDKDNFNSAVDMMQKRISQLIIESFGSQFYTKAVACIAALRQETIKSDKPKIFNDFLTKLKDTLVEKGRTNFWSELNKENHGLITKAESSGSDVTTEDAASFFSALDVPEEKKVDEDSGDAEDLLDELE